MLEVPLVSRQAGDQLRGRESDCSLARENSSLGYDRIADALSNLGTKSRIKRPENILLRQDLTCSEEK